MKTNNKDKMIEEAVEEWYKIPPELRHSNDSCLRQILSTLLTKHEEAVVDYIVDKMQIEVSEYKLTPFEQTVNTYIKNRGEEIKKEALQAIE